MKRSNRDPGHRPISPDPLFTHGFTKFPNAVLDSPLLPVGPKFLYGLLRRYAFQKQESFASQRRLALQCGVTERTIRRWMQPLTDLGLVRTTRPDPCRTNVYLLVDGTPELLAALGVPEPDRPLPNEADWTAYGDPFGEDPA